MKRQLSFLLLVALSLVPRSASADTLNISVVATGNILHEWDSGNQIATDLIETIVPSSIAADLADYTSIVVNLLAPSGQAFIFNPPSTAIASGFGLMVNYFYGTGGFGESWPSTIQFIGLQGPTPAPILIENGGRLAGNQIFFNVGYALSGPTSFTGLRIESTGPFSSAGSVVYPLADARISGSYVPFPYIDQGQFVSIAPVPEPATLLLLGTGLSAIALRRRRSNS